MSSCEIWTDRQVFFAAFADDARFTVKAFLLRKKVKADEWRSISTFTNAKESKEEMYSRLWSDLTEEHEHAHVELQKSGDTQCPSLRAAQRIKQQLSTQSAFPLLSPHIDLLLAVRKRAVLPILALLTLLYLCGTRQRENTQQNINVMVIKCVSDRLHIPVNSPRETYPYRVQKPPGNCSVQDGAESSSRWGRLNFWDDTAAHLFYSDVLPLADTYSPSLVDLSRRKK